MPSVRGDTSFPFRHGSLILFDQPLGGVGQHHDTGGIDIVEVVLVHKLVRQNFQQILESPEDQRKDPHECKQTHVVLETFHLNGVEHAGGPENRQDG